MQEIKTSEHVFITGMAGTGKSTLAEVYLSRYPNVIKYDTKREFEERRAQGKTAWLGLEEDKDFVIIESLDDLKYAQTGKVIYAPDYSEVEDETYINAFFKYVFEKQNTIIWIDELMSITSAQNCPYQLKRTITQGRSKNVGVWSCTQRPSGIPQIIPANCTHFFIFRLNLPQDIKRMMEVTGTPEVAGKLNNQNHEFWYYKAGADTSVKASLVIKMKKEEQA